MAGIEYHGAFVDLGQTRVQPIPIDTGMWRKMRRRGLRANAIEKSSRQ
jgi:hypothetical protein